MKRYSRTTGTIACGLCLTMVAAMVFAQDTQTRGRVETTRNRDRSQAGNLDDKTTGANVRASQLIGMNIQNSQDEGLGEVHDIVLDANAGRVKYLAVTYGGFLGVGNDLFAVPFEAFKVQRDPGDPDNYLLVLDVTQKQLEGAVGFDEDHWPDFADPKFAAELDTRYKVERKRRLRDRDIDIEAGQEGVDIDINSEPDTDRQ